MTDQTATTTPTTTTPTRERFVLAHSPIGGPDRVAKADTFTLDTSKLDGPDLLLGQD